MDRHAPPPERCVGLRPSGQRHGTSRRTGRAVPVSTRRCSGRPCLRFSGNRTVGVDYTRFSVLLSNRGDRARMPRCSAPCSPRKPTSDRLRAHSGARRDPCFTTEFSGPCRTPSGRSKWRPPGRGCPRPGYTPEHSAASVLLTNVVPRSRWWSARSPATRRSPSPATSTATSRRTSHAGRSTFSAGADEMVVNPSQ